MALCERFLFASARVAFQSQSAKIAATQRPWPGVVGLVAVHEPPVVRADLVVLGAKAGHQVVERHGIVEDHLPHPSVVGAHRAEHFLRRNEPERSRLDRLVDAPTHLEEDVLVLGDPAEEIWIRQGPEPGGGSGLGGGCIALRGCALALRLGLVGDRSPREGLPQRTCRCGGRQRRRATAALALSTR